MTAVKLCGIAILAVMLTATVRQLRPEIAAPMSAVTSVLLLTAVLTLFSPAVKFFDALDSDGALGEFSSHLQILIKALGIGLLTQSTADICRDTGEGAIAAKIELVGKAEIFVLGLPLISELLEVTRGLLL